MRLQTIRTTMRNRNGYYNDGVNRECTCCSKLFKITSRTVALCHECNSARVKSQAAETKMWRRARSRAITNCLEFNISVEDITIPDSCPVLGMRLEVHKGSSGGKPNSPALDRVDNSRGYIKGNIMVISHLANQMKASANVEELRKFAEWVLLNTPAVVSDNC